MAVGVVASPGRSLPRGLRKDIQGLRAVAVLLVVANHLVSSPSGGFVGVDIFFVISGFLITDLMLRERDRTGRISYSGFYRRRIRRIIPLSVLVLASTVGVSYYIYRPIRAGIIRGDALWSSIFMSNWHFAAAGTDYFNNENLTSPLQHFWSLAVEEQYYLVWPVAVIGLGMLAVGRISHRQVLAGVLLIAIAASFAFAMWESSTESTRAYFSTLSRAWELGVGALLAVLAPRLDKLPVRIQPVLSWVGLLGITLSVVMIGPDSTFPAPWAVLPVISTALVIGAGMSGGSRLLLPLTNPITQYIGNISYSLYLWHFPVIILMEAYFPDPHLARLLAILAVMAIVTVLGFHFVEDPIRRSTWLEPRSSKMRKVRYRDNFDPDVMKRLGYSTLVASAVATLVLATYLVFDTPLVQVASAGVQPVASPGAARPATFQEKLKDQLVVAANASAFPALDPA
ncbi:MAG: acyltransferase, partial [Actinomycetota bacterium]|nr:acyltransferase [Actinomycetota bacterium]